MSKTATTREKWAAVAAHAWDVLAQLLVVLSFAGSLVTALIHLPYLSALIFGLALIATLLCLVVHYRRSKIAYAQHVMVISDASRFLAASVGEIVPGQQASRRRLLERLLEAFRAVHETIPGHPGSGWRVSLWVPESSSKLRIIASLGISTKTEQSYFMGTDPECTDGLAWKAWKARESLTAQDAPNDKRVDHDQHIKTQAPNEQAPIGCLHCEVICLAEEVVGVISIDHREPGLFRGEDDDARSAVGGLVATALWNR